MINLGQQRNLPTQTQNKADKERITVTLCWDWVTTVDVENQRAVSGYTIFFYIIP